MIMRHKKETITPFQSRLLSRFFIGVLLVFSFLPLASAQELFESTVIKVIDGDTVRLENGRVVRYLGINAPELRKKIDNRWVRSPEPYAEEAADFNKKLVEGKKVLIEVDPAKKRDQFGRLTAYVYLVESKLLANEELLKAGLARADKTPVFMKHRKRFWSIEEMAWHDKRGMWAEPASTNAP